MWAGSSRVKYHYFGEFWQRGKECVEGLGGSAGKTGARVWDLAVKFLAQHDST